ncbi:MAG: VCBS repeat-containing protein [Verrucomicrobiota bacterium]
MTRIATYLTAAAGLRPLRPWLAVAVMLVRLGATAAESEPARTTVDPYRLNAQTMRRLSENQAKQNAAARTWPVFHQFKFSDALPQSGINFEHHIVDDAGKTWKPAHYDHGSAVAVADVDGDGLTDVFFVNQLGGNRLYRNLGQGRFADITASAGVALTSRVCVAASFADVDNDGRPDLFVTTVRMGNAFFKNMGGGRFQDTTKEAGLDYVGHSSGAVFFDFNRDGWVDLFLANVGVYTSDRQGRGGFYLAYDDAFRSHLIPARSESSILYQNLGGGRFQDVSAEMHLQDRSWSGDASACDLNQDGYPDLYVLNMQGDDHFYENDRGKGFIDRTARYFARTPWGTMGIKFFDFNLDGRMDLFLTDMHSDMTTSQTTLGKRDYSDRFSKEKSERWCSSEWTDLVLQGASNNIFGNAFYRNDGQGQFTEISDQLGAETYWPWGISVADFNADGYEDVFVTAGMGYPFRYGINSSSSMTTASGGSTANLFSASNRGRRLASNMSSTPLTVPAQTRTTHSAITKRESSASWARPAPGRPSLSIWMTTATSISSRTNKMIARKCSAATSRSAGSCGFSKSSSSAPHPTGTASAQPCEWSPADSSMSAITTGNQATWPKAPRRSTTDWMRPRPSIGSKSSGRPDGNKSSTIPPSIRS